MRLLAGDLGDAGELLAQCAIQLSISKLESGRRVDQLVCTMAVLAECGYQVFARQLLDSVVDLKVSVIPQILKNALRGCEVQ